MRGITKLIPAVVVALVVAVTAAFAAGVYTSGLPAAGGTQYPSTLPLTGLETFPVDTNLTQGLNPASESVTPGNITAIALENAMGRQSNIPIGAVAYGSLGTNTTDIAGQLWVSSFQMPYDDAVVTGIACLAGGTATTDKILGALYKQTLGGTTAALFANSALAGATLSGANTFQVLAFTAPLAITAGKYFMVVQGNGTTAGSIRTIAASTYIGVSSMLVAGSFGTLPATITFPTTFTADLAPICYVY